VASLRLELFGGFAIACDAAGAIALPGRKARALVAYLALAGERPQSRDRLAGLLWADSGEEQARTSLRQALSGLRKSLGDSNVLIADSAAIALAPGAVTCDVREFADALAEGSPSALERAALLYRGDLLEGFQAGALEFDEWLTVERERWRQQALALLARLAESQERAGQLGRATETTTRLLVLDSLREDAHRRLMVLYERQGRQSAALKQYRLCRAILQRELGVSPEATTEELYRRILRERRVSPVPASGLAAAEPMPGSDEPSRPAPPPMGGPELRHATVLVAELADSSVGAGETDPEQTHALLRAWRDRTSDRVARFGGTILSHVGSRAVAAFGVPMAHGNDAERAVRAALAILAGLPGEVGVGGGAPCGRVGIASGTLVVTQDADGLAVSGEPVNLAGRIVEAAAPGELWLSHRVRQALAQRLAADELTEVAIPASARPLKLWRARGMTDPWARRSALPFVGRQAELRQFDDILRDCFTARSGRVVVVRGDAGIGKSRLLEACAGRAREQGFACHKTLVLDFGGGGGPIEALVRELVDLAPDAPPAADREAAEAAVAQGWIGPNLVVFLHDFLDLPQPKPAQRVLQAMDNAARNRGRQAVVDELVRGRSARQPRLIVVEDIHWADAVVLDHLARLAAAIREFPVILVLSTRPENDPVGAGWRAAAGGTPRTTIDLGPLSDAEAALLATHYGAHDQGFVHACVARAEGNPLFLDQLLRAGEERGALPGSVQSLVLARLDRLDPVDRQAVQAAAVLGQRFSLAGLRALVADPDYACTALAEQALVRPEGEGWLFAHALIHEAVYASVLKSKRQALHRLAAAWYAADHATLVAEHLDAAGDAAAADAYLEAARGEAGQYRYERALGLAERGLTLADRRRLQHGLACLRGNILRELGRTVDSVAAFRQAIAFADGAHERCDALIGVAAGLRVLDRYDEALPALAEAEAAAVELDDAEALAEIHFVRGNIHFPRGEVDACRRAHEQALAHARDAGSALAEARALGGLGDAYYQEGRMRSARDHFDRCIALAREHGFVRIELANLPMLAVLDIYLADPEAVTRHCHAALDLAARIGDLRGEMLTRDILSAFQHMRGAWVLSRVEAERSLELARRLGAQRFEAEALAQIGLAAHGLGDTEEAARLLDAAWALTRVTGPQYIGPTVLGFIAQTTHDPDRRRWALAEGEALLAAGCVSHAHLYFYDAAIAASLGTDEWEAAERYADALSAYVRDEPLPWTDFASACGRLLARVGRGERDDSLLAHLQALRAMAVAAQWTVKLPDLDAALARMG